MEDIEIRINSILIVILEPHFCSSSGVTILTQAEIRTIFGRGPLHPIRLWKCR